MTPEQFVLAIPYSFIFYAFVRIAIRIFTGIRNVKKSAEILGKNDDNTALTAIVYSQLRHDETLLCYSVQKSSVVSGIMMFALACVLFDIVCVNLFKGYEYDDFGYLVVFSILFTFCGMRSAFSGCRRIFEDKTIFYFVTDRRLCIRTITRNGVKEQDIQAKMIRSVSSYTFSTRSGTRRRSDVTVWTRDGKTITLRPSNVPELSQVLREISGLETVKH